MTTATRDQPSKVSTQEAPRAPDEHIVTSDTGVTEPGEATSDAAAAAADTDKGDKGSNDQQSAPGDKQAGNHKQRHSSKRWDKLNARLGKSERDNAVSQQAIADLQQENTELKAKQAKAPEPQLEDFDSPKDYAKAFSKWETDTTAAAEPPKPKPAATEPAAAAASPSGARASDDEVTDFTKRGTEKLGDSFRDAIQDDPDDPTPVNQVMGEFIFDSDVGPEIFVHLANNKEEAKKIYDSSPRRAEKMLNALEAKAAKGELDVGEGALNVAPPPDLGEHDTLDKDKGGKGSTGTNAPEPVNTKEGGDASLTSDPETESMDVYANRRRKEELRKQGHVVD